MWDIHPLDKFLKAAELEWEHHCDMLRKTSLQAFNKPRPAYPYTQEVVRGLLQKEHEQYLAWDKQNLKTMGNMIQVR